jgi:eukaryotic-like serine/threonine-protein kinase
MSLVEVGNSDRYQILERIAEGGMAVVDRALAIGPDGFQRELVLKRIRPRFSRDERFARMFVDEARIVSQLFHSNIVQIYEFGKIDGDYFLAMEYVPGVDLARLLARLEAEEERFPLPLAIFVTIEICRALDYAHRKRGPDGASLNIVHRDVSPVNVLISTEGAVKLADFGIARANERREQTMDGVIKGKVAFMAPEQLRDEPLDGRSDLYSAAVVLYRMLAGRHPYAGRTDGETIQRALEVVPAPLSDSEDGVPTALDAILSRALSKERRDRHATAAELVEDLEAFLFDHRLRASASELSALMRGLYGDGGPARSSPPSSSNTVTLGLRGFGERNLPEYKTSSERPLPRALQGGRCQGGVSASKVETLVMFELPAYEGGGESSSAAGGERASEEASARADLMAATAPAIPGLWENRLERVDEAPAAPETPLTAVGARGVDDGASTSVDALRGRGALLWLLIVAAVAALGLGGVYLARSEHDSVSGSGVSSDRVGGRSPSLGAAMIEAGASWGVVDAGVRAPSRNAGDASFSADLSMGGDADGVGEAGPPRERPMASDDRGERGQERRADQPTPRVLSMGWLRVVTRPHFAEVFIDGRRRGTTPLLLKVPVGRRRVRLVNDQLGRSEQRSVQISRRHERGAPAVLSIADF